MSEVKLSDAEWQLMQCIWREPSCTLRDILNETGWAKHTVITLLKRMQAKGAIEVGKTTPKTYSPLLEQNEALLKETRDILQRVYGGNPLLMVQNAVESSSFSEDEIDALLRLIKKEGL